MGCRWRGATPLVCVCRLPWVCSGLHQKHDKICLRTRAHMQRRLRLNFAHALWYFTSLRLNFAHALFANESTKARRQTKPSQGEERQGKPSQARPCWSHHCWSHCERPSACEPITTNAHRRHYNKTRTRTTQDCLEKSRNMQIPHSHCCTSVLEVPPYDHLASTCLHLVSTCLNFFPTCLNTLGACLNMPKHYLNLPKQGTPLA